MEDEKEALLLGLWVSPFVRMAKIALKLKGIPYEYIEDSLKKKSELLLGYNPVYKKVPVLVHHGKPICESLVILEYIDDTWEHPPHLLPKDPYIRSRSRFWSNFIHNQIFGAYIKVFSSPRTQQQSGITELGNKLSVLEENMKVIFKSDDEPPSSDEEMGMLDIILSTLPNEIQALEEAFDFKTIIDPQIYPSISSRIASLSQLSVVKHTAPSHEKLVKFFMCKNSHHPRLPCSMNKENQSLVYTL